jgi:hypothetical protein
MKRALLLKIAGVTFLVVGTFFTSLTSVAEVGPRFCVAAGNPCPGPYTPFQCCGFCSAGRVCRDWPVASLPQ